MLTARASAKVFPASNDSRRRSTSAGKDFLLSLPHWRSSSRLIVRMIMTRDVKSTMNDESSKLLPLAHSTVTRVSPRHFRADVNVSDRGHPGGFPPHAE